ncbi:DoxX family protein [Robertkochia flava]|uniref:DoxX family protein n=1 Tax=Robertkochia flava TaxID=3447986 RepID=UPI001CCAE4AC|nr:DoxX family protein [Robertkochia marina]
MYYLESLILLFVLITFLQSGIDKITDWKGNVEWLNGHFKDSLLNGKVPLALGIILVLEVFTAATAVLGMYYLWSFGDVWWAMVSLVLSGITLLFLLLGQRLAKDYDGARTIVIYLMPVLFGLYVMQLF